MKKVEGWPWFSVSRTILADVRLIKCAEGVSSLFRRHFLNRIAPEGAGTNKENIPSSKGSRWGCVEEEAGSSSADLLGGDRERTPKPRKHSPTLVPLTHNQDTPAVSGFAAGCLPLTFISFSLCHRGFSNQIHLRFIQSCNYETKQKCY